MHNEFGEPQKPLPRWTALLFVLCIAILLIFFIALFITHIKMGAHRWNW